MAAQKCGNCTCSTGAPPEQAQNENHSHGRHQKGERRLQVVKQAREILENSAGVEFMAVDLRSCLNALGEIVGETTPDDLLGQIFSEFCIGK